jgi:hypothetical protein
MAWVESHQEIGKHPKTKRAARLAGVSIPTMVGHLHMVWHYALDFAESGDVTHLEPWQIEDAAMWDGAEGKLHAALVESGYIDVDEEGNRSLHHWHDYAGKLIERRRVDSERKRKLSAPNPPKRSGTPVVVAPDSTGTPTEIHRNSDGIPTEAVQSPSVTLTVTTTSSEVPHGTSGAEAPIDHPDDGVPEQPTDDTGSTKELPENGPAQRLVAWWCRKTGVEKPASYGKAVGAARDLHAAGITTPAQAEELYEYCLTILSGGITLNAMLASLDSFWAVKNRPPRTRAAPISALPPPPQPRREMAKSAEELHARSASFMAGTRGDT